MGTNIMGRTVCTVVAEAENGMRHAFGPLAEPDAHALAARLTEGCEYDTAEVLELEDDPK